MNIFKKEAYQQEYYKLAYALASGTPVPKGDRLTRCNHTFNFLPPVVEDTAPSSGFGSIEEDVKSSYNLDDVVNVTFWGSDLRNHLNTNATFLSLQREESGKFVTVADDADFETRLYWERKDIARSLVKLSWHIPKEYGPIAVKGGTFRLRLTAWRKPLIGQLIPYIGDSSTFKLN